MAGTMSDFVIYDEEFFGRLNEVLQQELNVFNENSANTMRMVTRSILGEFERESFMKRLTNNISHRDVSSTSPVASQKMEQDELVGVKVNRRIGPNDMTIDSWKKIGEDPAVFSFFYGEQSASDVLADYVNTAALVAQTTIAGNAAVVADKTAETESKLRTEYLLDGLALMGDRASRVRAWVMHSAPFFQLARNQTLEKITNVSDVVIYGGAPGTYDRPVIVTDSPALVDDSVTNNNQYYVLGLTEGAVEIAQSESDAIWTDPKTGTENLSVTIQGEYAFNVRSKGHAWTGDPNPTDAQLASDLNWSYRFHDNKMGPGVAIKVSEETIGGGGT